MASLVLTDFANAGDLNEKCELGTPPATYYTGPSMFIYTQNQHEGRSLYHHAEYTEKWAQSAVKGFFVQAQRPAWIELPYKIATIMSQGVTIFSTRSTSESFTMSHLLYLTSVFLTQRTNKGISCRAQGIWITTHCGHPYHSRPPMFYVLR